MRLLLFLFLINHADNYDYLLFIDSDIDFESKTIFKMIGADKDVIACPYPMKMIDTDRMWAKLHQTELVKTKDDLLKMLHIFTFDRLLQLRKLGLI